MWSWKDLRVISGEQNVGKKITTRRPSQRSIREAVNEPDTPSFGKTTEYLDDFLYVTEPFDSMVEPESFRRPRIHFVYLKKSLDLQELRPITKEQLDSVPLLPEEVQIGHVTYKVWFLFLLGAPAHKIAQSFNEYRQVVGSSSRIPAKDHDMNIDSSLLGTRARLDESPQDAQSQTFVKNACAHKNASAYNSAPAHIPHSYRDLIPHAAS